LPAGLVEAYARSTSDSAKLEQHRFYVEILTLIVAVVVALFTIYQWRATKLAADAASKSANAASGSLDLARTEQRPWVSPIGFTLNKEPAQVGDKLEVTTKVSNSGKTPALHVTNFFAIDGARSESTLPILDYSNFRDIAAVIFPGMTVSLNTSKPLIV